METRGKTQEEASSSCDCGRAEKKQKKKHTYPPLCFELMVRLRAQSCKHQAFNSGGPPECPADGPFKKGLLSKWGIKVISPMPSRGGGGRGPWRTEPPCLEVQKMDTEMVPHIGAIWCPCGARMIPNGATNVSETRGKEFLDKIL